MAESLGFPRRLRLSRGSDFVRIRKNGVRACSGPLLVYVHPNHCAYPRLGLSVSARIAQATRRNVFKRRLREAFRHGWRDWPTAPRAADGSEPNAEAYDVVVSVRAHEPLPPSTYRRLLFQAVLDADSTWQRKLKSRSCKDTGSDQ